jgi:hypothetical protein
VSDDETSIRVKRSTKKKVVQARGKLEQRDGKKRSFDDVISELCDNELTRLFD